MREGAGSGRARIQFDGTDKRESLEWWRGSVHACHVPDDLLTAANLTAAEFRLEMVVTLFQQDRLTLGQAAAFAGLTQLEMQRPLASRRIPLHYGMQDLDHDLATVKRRLQA